MQGRDARLRVANLRLMGHSVFGSRPFFFGELLSSEYLSPIFGFCDGLNILPQSLWFTTTPRKTMISGWVIDELSVVDLVSWAEVEDPRFPMMFLLVLLHTTPFPVYPDQLSYW